MAQLLHTLSNAPTVPIRQLAPWVPENIAAVVDKARAKNVDDRYADANALHAALVALLPEGTKIRDEMVVGVPEQVRRVVPVDANTVVDARGAMQNVNTPETIAPTLIAGPQPAAAPSSSNKTFVVGIVVVVLVVIAGILAMR